MGLPFRASPICREQASAKAAADAAFARIALLNTILSDYDPDSELSRLSHTSGREKLCPSAASSGMCCSKPRLAARTDGAFDVTVGPLVNLWRRARRKRELPSGELIAEMKARVGWQQMKLDEAARTVTLLLPEMRLDCASLAKGYAVDAALALLRERGISRALVAGGGDMAAGDPPPGQPGWRIEVATLDAPGAPPGQTVLLQNNAIGTSGDVFQHLEVNGIRYSHIVDPKTGLGLTDHSLVSVLGPKCSVASSHATAVSVWPGTRFAFGQKHWLAVRVVRSGPGRVRRHLPLA